MFTPELNVTSGKNDWPNLKPIIVLQQHLLAGVEQSAIHLCAIQGIQVLCIACVLSQSACGAYNSTVALS